MNTKTAEQRSVTLPLSFVEDLEILGHAFSTLADALDRVSTRGTVDDAFWQEYARFKGTLRQLSGKEPETTPDP